MTTQEQKMTQEEAEAILSNPESTEEQVLAARDILDVDDGDEDRAAAPPAAKVDLENVRTLQAVPEADPKLEKSAREMLESQPLSVTLAELAKRGTTAEQGAYEELLLILSEAKLKIRNVAQRMAGDLDHIVHDINGHFENL